MTQNQQDSKTDQIPDDFNLPGFAPFSALIGPVKYKTSTDENGKLQGSGGLIVKESHIGGNNRGHGGVMLTLLDEAMGMTAALQNNGMSVVTISLQTNFIAATIPGKFLYATGTITKKTSTMAFVEGKAWCGDTLVGNATGIWKYLRKRKSFSKK